MEAQAATAPPSARSCAFCITPLEERDDVCECPQCGTPYHADCWQENSGCGVYGCGQSPAVEPRQALEIPMSYWGNEEKQCPACHKTIQAAAVRCRHCGSTFDAAPQDADAFRSRKRLDSRLPAIRRTATILTLLCLFPFTAPLGLLFGGIWLPLRWKDLGGLPSLYRTLCCVSMAVAFLMTVGTLLFALGYQSVPAF